MKKVISLVLIFSLILSISLPKVSYASETANAEVLFSEFNLETTNYEEIIKIQDSYIYSKKDETSTISFTVKDGKIVDFGYNDYSGIIKTITDEPYNLIKYNRTAGKSELKEEMRNVANLIKTNTIPSKPVEERLVRNIQSAFTTTIGSNSLGFDPISAFKTEMRGDGYNEHGFKVVASKVVRGIPCTVNADGVFSVQPQNNFLVNISTTVGIVSATVGLATGSVLAIGVFVLAVGGAWIAAKNQVFTNYNLMWSGHKYVSLYGQGNYHQAAAAARWKGVAGERGVTTNSPSYLADSYYDNNSMLMDLGASKY